MTYDVQSSFIFMFLCPFLCKALCTALAGGVLTTLQGTSLFYCFSDGKKIILGLKGFFSELPTLWIKNKQTAAEVFQCAK